MSVIFNNKLKIDIEIIRESLNLYENINYSQDFIYVFETSQIQQLKQDIDKLYEIGLSNLFIIFEILNAFPGIALDEKITTSSGLNLIYLCVPLDILDNAASGSP